MEQRRQRLTFRTTRAGFLLAMPLLLGWTFERDDAGECDDDVDNDQDGVVDCDDPCCAAALVYNEDGSIKDDAMDDDATDDDVIVGAPYHSAGGTVESRCVAPPNYPPPPERFDGESCCTYARRWDRWSRDHPCRDHPDWIFGHGSCDEICSGPERPNNDVTDDDVIAGAPHHSAGRTVESRCVVPPNYPPPPERLDGESYCAYALRYDQWSKYHPCRDHPDWIFAHGSCDEICSGPE